MLPSGQKCTLLSRRSHPLQGGIARASELARGSLIRVRGKPPQKNKGLYFDYQPVDPNAQQQQTAKETERLKDEFSWVNRARVQNRVHTMAPKPKKKSFGRRKWEKAQERNNAVGSNQTEKSQPKPKQAPAPEPVRAVADALMHSEAAASPATQPPAATVPEDPWSTPTAEAPSSASTMSNSTVEVAEPKQQLSGAMLSRKQRLMRRMQGGAPSEADVPSSRSSAPSASVSAAAAHSTAPEAAIPVITPSTVEPVEASYSRAPPAATAPKSQAAGGSEEDIVFDENMDVNAFAQQLIEMLTGRGGDEDDEGDTYFDFTKVESALNENMGTGYFDNFSEMDIKKYLELLGDEEEEDDGGNFSDLVSKIEDDESLDDKEKMKALYSLQGMFNAPAQAHELEPKGSKKSRGSGPALPGTRTSTTGMAKATMNLPPVQPGAKDDEVVIPLKPKPSRPRL